MDDEVTIVDDVPVAILTGVHFNVMTENDAVSLCHSCPSLDNSSFS